MRFQRARTTVVHALMVSALILWFSSIYLWMHFDATRPTHPDTASGRLYPQNTHGSIVYLNASEQFQLRCLDWGSGVTFLFAVLLSRWWNVQFKSGGPLDDLPREVRHRILNSPPYDYEKARTTYNTKSDDDQQGHN
jgi:hypothetical protein